MASLWDGLNALSRSLSASVALAQVSFDKEQLLKDLKERWGIVECKIIDEDVLLIADAQCELMLRLIKGPIPDNIATKAARECVFWPQALEVAASHKACLSLVEQSNCQDILEKAIFLSKVTDACCCQKYAQGVFSPYVAIAPKAYQETTSKLKEGIIPIYNWISMGCVLLSDPHKVEKTQASANGVIAATKDPHSLPLNHKLPQASNEASKAAINDDSHDVAQDSSAALDDDLYELCADDYACLVSRGLKPFGFEEIEFKVALGELEDPMNESYLYFAAHAIIEEKIRPLKNEFYSFEIGDKVLLISLDQSYFSSRSFAYHLEVEDPENV